MSATSSASRCGSGSSGRIDSATGSRRSASEANASFVSASTGRHDSTVNERAAARARTCRQTVVLPMPGAPSKTMAAGAPASRSRNRSIASSSTLRPTTSCPDTSRGGPPSGWDGAFSDTNLRAGDGSSLSRPMSTRRGRGVDGRRCRAGRRAPVPPEGEELSTSGLIRRFSSRSNRPSWRTTRPHRRNQDRPPPPSAASWAEEGASAKPVVLEAAGRAPSQRPILLGEAPGCPSGPAARRSREQKNVLTRTRHGITSGTSPLLKDEGVLHDRSLVEVASPVRVGRDFPCSSPARRHPSWSTPVPPATALLRGPAYEGHAQARSRERLLAGPVQLGQLDRQGPASGSVTRRRSTAPSRPASTRRRT